MTTIRSSKDIIVGYFYRAGDKPWYYVGIKYGRGKRLVVVNLSRGEVETGAEDPLFPNDRSMYKEWDFHPITQWEVLNRYLGKMI
jgi:hypothetical protein